MIACIQEHDEVHGHFDTSIEVFQIFSNFLKHHRNVLDLNIRPVIAFNSIKVITKDNSFNIKQLFLLQIILGSFIHQQIKQNQLILIVNHTITKHSIILMDPESEKIFWCYHFLFVSCTDALEDFGNVSQVERVVRFAWCWSQVRCHAVEDVLG